MSEPSQGPADFHFERNLRRRTVYRELPPEQKAVLLERRRARYAARRCHAPPKPLNPDISDAATSSSTLSTLPAPPNIAIPAPPAAASNGPTVPQPCWGNGQQLLGSPAILREVPPCSFCHAIRLQYEPPGFCCGSGAIKLASHELLPELRHLYFGHTDEAAHFRTYIRTYNNMFAFTSLGVKYDKDLASRTKGVYTFKVQGQMHHFLPTLTALDNKAKNMQVYFYDNEAETIGQMAFAENLDKPLITQLLHILQVNPYSAFLKSLRELHDLSSFYVALRCDSSQDQRTYNLPSVPEVSALWTDDDSASVASTPHIRIYPHGRDSQVVHYYYGCYDPLQYPLLFPRGEHGWHCGIPKTPGRTSLPGHIASSSDPLPNIQNVSSMDGFLTIEEDVLRTQRPKKNMVSCREYYCYKLQVRSATENATLHSGRLFQQYSVDQYIKLETQRLDFLLFNQDLFRTEVYAGLMDLQRMGEREASNIGRKTFLPATFTGGPRDMRRRYMDAIALVQHFGKPDIFLTMTCNPSWPEITKLLLPTDEAQNRPDLISRIFRAKVEELKCDLFRKRLFGKVVAYMYTIEFQKRGLPHAHFLIVLSSECKLLTLESYDRIVCAELPDSNNSPYLHSLVTKHMMHGPCGNLNPKNSCMHKKGKCKFRYPKKYAAETSRGENSYPLYRRRNTGTCVQIRNQYLDNAWVVPYNPYLLSKYNCHINVEVCADIKVVKYIYKYICKGHDKISFSVQATDASTDVDEIREYRSARWVSPPEATWRLFAFPISEMSPAVYRLHVHLPDQQLVSFRTTATLTSILTDAGNKRTMLTEFFNMNLLNADVRSLNLLYKEFPQHFVWSNSTRKWSRRKRSSAIGRIVSCHPTEGERYYLRVLLMNVPAPTSYTDLLNASGKTCMTFRESAEQRGLLASDNNLIESLAEASTYQMPCSLRRLFAMLLVYCNPATPLELWQQFELPMSEDFAQTESLGHSDIRALVLNHINSILNLLGRNIDDFNLLPEKYANPLTSKQIIQEARDVFLERNIHVSAEELELHTQLNTEQKSAYHTILRRVFSHECGAFFIDGPGGTGKTFLYRSLLATIRSKGLIALATATSGVAASVLPGGRTAHSRFKLPIDTCESYSCCISKQSSLASLIRDAQLIVWDEVSMAKKRLIQTFDLLLQDLMGEKTIFGGKVVVFGGDFRQTLPVVKGGSKDDFANESLLNSDIWNRLETIHLLQNMRAQHDPAFCDYLLRIGNGQEQTNEHGKIEIPTSLLIPFTNEKDSLNTLFSHTYPNIEALRADTSDVTSRVILTTKNDFVDDINAMFIEQFPSNGVAFTAIDETVDPKDQSQFEDFLHTLNPPSLPPYRLVLKRNCPIMLLRNLNPSEGLCNGTRLVCSNINGHIISATIATGDSKGKHAFIPRIPLLSPSDEKLTIPFKRTQFPVRLCFAMTINKAQGQTLDFMGIYLREPVFSHGQLYVALSRAKNSGCVKIVIRPPTADSHDDHSTTNVVYAEIIQKMLSSTHGVIAPSI